MAYNMGTHNGNTQWINLEPCGLFCGSMTYGLLMFGMFATSRYVIIPWLGFSVHGLFHLILFNCMSIMGAYSHFKAMTTDPGAVPKNAKPLADDAQEHDHEANENKTERYKKYCKRCHAFKPARAHHCSLCGRCIVKMDHHCPWVNNCVGVGNHKLFLLFIFWVFVTCIYSMVLVVGKYVVCIYDNHAAHCNGEVDSHLMVIFLMVESVLFGLFTLCMLGDQISSILSNQTQIDRLKNTKYKQQSEVNEVFGTPAHMLCARSWMYPVPVHFGEGALRDSIMGYVEDVDQSNEMAELAPLITAANATVGTNSPLHPDYVPNRGANKTNPSGRGLPSRNRRRPETDSDEESGSIAEEECISEWISDSDGPLPQPRSHSLSSSHLLNAALGNAPANVTRDQSHESGASDSDHVGGNDIRASAAATAVNNNNTTTVRKRS